ncbi:MAG: sensor domain-containing diguanylate cyclase [Paucimonas sp.]|jgi:diguanylate cyclase (GGDEF)-like protein|nr:sensor domain-containing diguanylate cyclase [Paucimonas sp.]
MKKATRRRLDLRFLMLAFAIFSALATLANSLVVAYGVQRDALIHATLEANHAYAAKVASSIGAFLASAHAHLDYSAQQLAEDFTSQRLLHAEARRLQEQDEDFNTVVITDADGKVLHTHPDNLLATGSNLNSEEVRRSVEERRPLISHAYTSSAGNLMVFISQPIFAADGSFLGVIGGAMYIRQNSALGTVVSHHFHHDGTFAFVADKNRRLLHHPDNKRIGQVLKTSATVDAALRGETGSMAVNNYLGVPMLAGYAPVPNADWAVVAQQPRAIALSTLGKLMQSMFLDLLPASIVGLLLLWIGARWITRPLQQLADSATHLSQAQTIDELGRIKAWYKEPAAIRRALIASVQSLHRKIGRLSEEAQSDPMTGLANRRGMNAALDMLDQSQRPYAALALDIDYFKRVNDNHGHDAGDVALKQVADILNQHSRADDLACRAGGEEFVLLLPDTDTAGAAAIAERIRIAIAAVLIPQVGHITISIGVATRGPALDDAPAILKQADDNLYRAKAAGRNRVVA